jgi:hypothetical protein
MILTPSEVALLAKMASFWELAEYVSEALVGIGCLGEYIAEYSKWPPKWTDEQRHRLGRRSLILLIVGIGAGLVSLVQTNALSGEVIGSLGEQVEEAGRKAKLLADSTNAVLLRSGQAVTSSEKALAQSGKAEGASSNALALARAARQEADSFEKDIVLAKKQATAAEAHLAEAMQRTSNAEREADRLARDAMPRRLSESQKAELVKLLSAAPAFTVVFGATRSGSNEILDFTDDFIDVFARMKLVPPDSSSRKFPRAIAAVQGRGVIVGVKSQAEHPPAADVLIGTLKKWGFDINGEAAPDIVKSATEMHILIGAKQ